MNTSIQIKRTPQEHRELRLVVRAQMILLLASGENFSATARKVGNARRIVYKWARRFIAARAAGLKDKPRSGRPARFPPDRADVSDHVR